MKGFTMICKRDHHPMEFHASSQGEGREEGLYICPLCRSKSAYLVAGGIIDALPSELMSAQHKALLAKRLAELSLAGS